MNFVQIPFNNGSYLHRTSLVYLPPLQPGIRPPPPPTRYKKTKCHITITMSKNGQKHTYSVIPVGLQGILCTPYTRKFILRLPGEQWPVQNEIPDDCEIKENFHNMEAYVSKLVEI